MDEDVVGELPCPLLMAAIYEGIDIEWGLLYREPASDKELEESFLCSKLWRLNNLYTIINKDGERVQYVMNLSQHRTYAAILRWYRLLILKSRQQGISTFWLLNFIDDALFYPDLNIGLMAQGKDEAKKLLRRVKLAWRCFDPAVKRILSLRLETDSAEGISFSNGSTIYIAVSFRSATLQRLHVSELGKIANNSPERARELKTGTLQALKAGMVGAIESTAEGDNMFRVMWDEAIACRGVYAPKDWHPLFLSWMDDPDCVSTHKEHEIESVRKYLDNVSSEWGELSVEQRNFWIMQKRELGEDVYQEYPSTAEEAFIAVKDGTYYSRLYMRIILQGREVVGLYDPKLSVHVAMDLGYNDTFVMVYYQKWGTEWRIIDEYYNDGYEIEHYVKDMVAKPYTINRVTLPHDGAVHELQTGMTREAFMRTLGVRGLLTNPKTGLDNGIDEVRKMMKNLWIDKKCVYLISCLKGYKKIRDENHNVWKNKPQHNEHSNGADAVRQMAVGPRLDSIRLDRVSPYSKPQRSSGFDV